MVLQASPSSFWSGSAGAIYPLLKRLENAELVQARADPTDRRGRRLLKLTVEGTRAHRQWMLAADSDDVAAAVSDPIRSRAFFLSALRTRDRQRFVAASIRSLESYLETARVDLEKRAEREDSYSYLAALGAVYQAESRVNWMKEIAAHLSQTTE